MCACTTSMGILKSQRNMECKLKPTAILGCLPASAPRSLLWPLSMTSVVTLLHIPATAQTQGWCPPPGPSLSLLSAYAHVTCLPLPICSTGNVKHMKYMMSQAKLLLGLSMAARAEHGFSGPRRAAAALETAHFFSSSSFHSLFPSPT